MSPRPSSAHPLDGLVPLVSDARWRRLKDAVYGLLIHRAEQLPRMTFGDRADRSLIEHLSKLDPSEEARDWMMGSVFDMGYDLGRHVYAKRILHDNLKHALDVLAGEVAESGLGAIEITDVFHRQAELDFRNTGAGEPDSAPTIRFFVAGLILGSLEDVFNATVEIMLEEGSTIQIKLGEGRNVNKEVAADG